jgi:hypothetical protein
MSKTAHWPLVLVSVERQQKVTLTMHLRLFILFVVQRLVRTMDALNDPRIKLIPLPKWVSALQRPNPEAQELALRVICEAALEGLYLPIRIFPVVQNALSCGRL